MTDRLPSAELREATLRVKPALKPITIAVLAGASVLCGAAIVLAWPIERWDLVMIATVIGVYCGGFAGWIARQ